MDRWVRVALTAAPCKARRSMVAACLLALLLSLGLPQVRTSNRTGKQVGLTCHVCETENDFACKNEVVCHESEEYCNFVAAKVFPRVYYISKQCSKICPYIWPVENTQPKSFLVEKPLPFFYVNCCKSSLCNLNGPTLSEDVFREQAGRASVSSHGQAILTILVASATTFTGLSLL
ncbi:Lymphocyte antigen 6K [Sciurus carolinensis]|uniref:Lymphocyte antigen 6K n=1 Tax=Sciurus carolinensis TaxID=30640 RepID=A0AA41TC32_SCICA|nr:Lymphocyte antigen 6K [Sciurus carolinensis]